MCSKQVDQRLAIYLILAGVVVSFGTTSVHADALNVAQSQWVHPGPDGKLVYKTTPQGDRMMDFSYAGYMGGGVALPTVAVKKTVAPSGQDDDTDTIQSAINEVAKLPLVNGFRGAVLLTPGTYACSQTIRIATSGIVLRGSGSGAPIDSPQGGSTAPASSNQMSTIKLVGDPHLAIGISTSVRGNRGPDDETDAIKSTADSTAQKSDFKAVATSIADAYVPSGTTSFTVASAKGFAVGDTIEIEHPVTQSWVKFMQMDDMVRDGKAQTWIRVGNNIAALRNIKGISGNTISVDVPLSDSFDAKYLSPPGAAVVKVRPPTAITQSGIEDLHIECPPQAINHTQRHFQALRISGQDCWARNVVCDETMNSVSVSGRRITLLQVSVNRRAEHQGASKPAEFAPNASQVLLDHCSVTADNVWFAATGAGVSGPIVLLNCTFRGKSDAEAHQRWSTGILYDNCDVPEGGITLRNRGSMGSGHGWTMGWGVIWNCAAKDYIVQNPPGAVNWLIGSVGHDLLASRPFGAGPNLPEGIIDSANQSVSPHSLYLAQLAERLGPEAVKNIGY